MNFFNILSYLWEAITSVISFISTLFGVMGNCFSTMFVSFPSFISLTLSFTFTMGLFILIIKLAGNLKL